MNKPVIVVVTSIVFLTSQAASSDLEVQGYK